MKVPTYDFGQVEVRCFYRTPKKYFAVHRSVVRDDGKPVESDVFWSITHVPTGKALYQFVIGPLSLQKEKALALENIDNPDRWDFDNANHAQKLPKKFMDKARRIISS